MDEQCGVYAIVSPSGKAYIGSSVRLNKRRTRHFYELRSGVHHCQPLQRAFVKYGDCLSFVVLELCERGVIRQRELFWLENNVFAELYNSINAVDQKLVISDDVRARISASKTGRSKTEETKRRMSKPKSAAHAAAISAGKKGRTIVYTEAGLAVRRASMAKAQLALAAKRQAAKADAHMAMLEWIVGA